MFKTVTFAVDDTGVYFHDFGAGKDFLDRSQCTLNMKTKINKLDLITIKNVSSSKDTFKRVGRQEQNGNKHLQYFIWKNLLIGYVTNSHKLLRKKTIYQKKWAKYVTRNFTKKITK